MNEIRPRCFCTTLLKIASFFFIASFLLHKLMTSFLRGAWSISFDYDIVILITAHYVIESNSPPNSDQGIILDPAWGCVIIIGSAIRGFNIMVCCSKLFYFEPFSNSKLKSRPQRIIGIVVQILIHRPTDSTWTNSKASQVWHDKKPKTNIYIECCKPHER
jgi:hypothetical protein